MIRRDFCKTSLALAGLALGSERAGAAATPASEEFPKAPGLTKYVSEFIVNTKYEDIPENVIAIGKKTILDGFGLSLAGSAAESGPHIRQYIETLGCTGGKASIICELGNRSGKDLMLAFHVGVEVENKIGDAAAPRHQREGYHTTGTCGVFGSTAASAKLRGLNVKQTAYALGVAGSESSGVRANFGSMTKPFNAGHAADCGTQAADLASLGWTAADDILESPLGFYRAGGGGFAPAAIVDRLGKPWMFASAGDLIKRFPCGTIQQQVMDGMLRLIEKNNVRAADVDRVEVGGNLSNYETLFRHHPTSGLEGKFSMEFCMAILLLERKATLSSFTDAVVQRPDVQDMIRRVRYYVDPEFDKRTARGESLQAVLVEESILKVYMKDGKVLTERTVAAKGSPENPMTFDEVADKFRGNAEFAKWPSQKAEAVIQLVKSLESVPDMSRLTAALAV